MSEPEKHHYLPVFYLRQWANRDGKVIRYYRPYRDVVASPISPDNTGYEDGLYGLGMSLEAGKNSIEKDFMSPVVDGPAAKALEALIKYGVCSLKPEQRQDWTRFIMSLAIRNPMWLKFIIQKTKNHFQEIFDFSDQEFTVNFGKIFLPGIITHEKTSDAIMRMKWFTINLSSNPDLLTCDYPVLISDLMTDEKCVIAVPLSPQLVFFATRSEVAIDCIASKSGGEIVEWLNHDLVRQAEKYVYGAHDRYLGFVENRL